MKIYIALLRAVNVGGTGKLPMADLRAICIALGFENVTTYIQSGNVVFKSNDDEASIKAKLEATLLEFAKKPVGVMVRSHQEFKEILSSNPYKECAPNRTLITFLDSLPLSPLEGVKNLQSEQISLGQREIYVHYCDGMAQSRLLIPKAKLGTARNINTITKLVEMGQNL